MKNRFWAALLALSMTLTMLPGAALAAEGDNDEPTEPPVEDTTPGEDTENPDDGEDTENPDDGEDTENPDDGEDTENPDDGEDTENPDDGEDTENPDDGEDTENPDDGEDTENPDDGEDTENPPVAPNPGDPMTYAEVVSELNRIKADVPKEEIRSAVRDINRDSLKDAMASDISSAGSLLDTINELETMVGVTKKVNPTTALANYFPTTGVKFYGAGLSTNSADTVTLNISTPTVSHALPVDIQSSRSVHFSLSMEGVGGNLTVPMAVLLPVPTGYGYDEDTILLRYEAVNGVYEWNPVSVTRNDYYRINNQWYVAFVVDSLGELGEFALVDLADAAFIYIKETVNGTVTPSTRRPDDGEIVRLYVTPDKGYKMDTLTITDTRGRKISYRDLGDNAYSFTMPNSRVTVDVKFAKIEEDTALSPTDPANTEVYNGLGTPGISGIVLNPAAMPFTDVKSTDWFYNNVDYVWKHYLMSGVSDTQFAPNTTTSRAMIWTILARMNNVRTDINPGSTWYEKGMLWSMQQGVTDGTNPMDDITREQLVTMLYRNADKPGLAAGAPDLSSFNDAASVSDYAVTAMRWAVANGIINGDNGNLNPQGTATRAQVAAMVARYGDKLIR